MGGFCYGTLHVELKYTLGGGCPLLTKAQFRWIARSWIIIANKIDIGVWISRRPVAHEVFEKSIPAGNPVAPHVAQGKREAVIDPNDHRFSGFKHFEAILGDLQPCPVFCALGRRANLYGLTILLRFIHLQSLESAGRSLSTGVVDADVVFESHVSISSRFGCLLYGIEKSRHFRIECFWLNKYRQFMIIGLAHQIWQTKFCEKLVKQRI